MASTSRLSDRPDPEKAKLEARLTDFKERIEKVGAGLADVEAAVRRGVGFGQYQYVDVTFNATAHKDTEIRHALLVRDPYSVRFVPVSWAFDSAPADPPYIYRNSAVGARPWGNDLIILRSNRGSLAVRLLLFTEPSKVGAE